ncbi:MAG: hypothetical protein MI747_10965 [Desulfobacterales bacterium]|nr:hypothetical protein [Desulfobacterales bacterium]
MKKSTVLKWISRAENGGLAVDQSMGRGDGGFAPFGRVGFYGLKKFSPGAGWSPRELDL